MGAVICSRPQPRFSRTLPIMALLAPCPACQSKLSVPEELAGKKVRCAKCAHIFVVPLPAAVPPQPLVAEVVPAEPEVLEILPPPPLPAAVASTPLPPP